MESNVDTKKKNIGVSSDQILTTPGEYNESDNIFGIKDADLDIIFNKLSQLIADLDVSDTIKVKEYLENFELLETNIKSYLSSLTLTFLKEHQIHLLKLLTFEMLEEKFKENKKYSRLISDTIDSCYEKVLISDINKENLESYFDFMNFSDQKEKHDNNNQFNDSYSNQELNIDLDLIESTFKEINNYVYMIFLSELESKFSTISIPKFLLKISKKKIKSKISFLCNPFLHENYNIILENKIEVKVLKSFYNLLISDKITIFEKLSLDNNVMKSLYEIFILSNVNYFKSDPIAEKMFIKNFEKYDIAFQLNNDDRLGTYDINCKLEKIFNNFMLLPSNEIEDMLKFNIEILQSALSDHNEKYFFIIFSFSMLLNNIVSLNKEKKIIITSCLSCSSRERQLLINVLKSFKTYFNHSFDPLSINSYIQSIVIKDLLKKNCTSLLDSNGVFKEKMTIDKISKIINQTQRDSYINSDFTCDKKIVEKLNILINENVLGNSLREMLLQFKRMLNFNSNEYTVNLQSFNISHIDNFLLSTEANICISGFTSQNCDNQSAWENFTLSSNKFEDFYFLDWPSETNWSFLKDILLFIGKSVVNVMYENIPGLLADIHGYATVSNSFLRTRKSAKVCGKILAYILCSKAIYKSQTINLVGFSLGTHVIKSCLKQIYQLFTESNNEDFLNIVQNVVLVAGATHFKNKSKWKVIFDSCVSGRVINCYGKNDKILKILFKIVTLKDAIGEFPIDISSSKIENFNFSDLEIDHHEYRKSLHKILYRINL